MRYRRRVIGILLSFALLLPLAACGSSELEHEMLDELQADTETQVDGAITVFSKVTPDSYLQTAQNIAPYSDHYYGGTTVVSGSIPTALAYTLSVGRNTAFSENIEGYDRDALLEWGKYPGLNIDILQAHGFTGKGATVAYIDQLLPAAGHEEFPEDLHYDGVYGESMHAPAVLSLLAGQTIGTAPDAEVYFIPCASWLLDQQEHANALHRLIELNATLPEDKKITMVGLSDTINEKEKNPEAFRQAIEDCKAAGIMVWLCDEYISADFYAFSNKNSFDSLKETDYNSGNTPLYVPAGGRTTAATNGNGQYIYWADAGISWTMPYVLGLYANAIAIDPELTQEELRDTLLETAYMRADGIRIVDPVEFISSVLDGVGRSDEATQMRDEVKARNRCLYAVVNPGKLTSDDSAAIAAYLNGISDATVLIVDASGFDTAATLYDAMKADAAARGMTVAGVQIFGDRDSVPTFRVDYKVKNIQGLDEGESFCTDLFFGNFNNDSNDISSGYNVADHFDEGWSVDLCPQWPVVRLPLSVGKYSTFFKNYSEYVQETFLSQQPITNFSNPIFATTDSPDNMGVFLDRMAAEADFDVPYRLYGNLQGDCPVSNAVLGDFTAENMQMENSREIQEFIVNTHGQWNNIDRCTFSSGTEQRASVLNIDTINTFLSNNPYYLDMWACSNGREMAGNLITTVLNGRCVGAFAATSDISNNGTDNRAAFGETWGNNFYLFYYTYLQAIADGTSRSMAFLKAQQAYAQTLYTNSKKGIQGEGNYQYNISNLLCYHNFGVIEPNAMLYSACVNDDKLSFRIDLLPGISAETGADDIFPVTDGSPVGEISVSCTVMQRQPTEGKLTVTEVMGERLDNGYCRFRFTVETGADAYLSLYDQPYGAVISVGAMISGGLAIETAVDIREEQLSLIDDDMFVLSASPAEEPEKAYAIAVFRYIP